MSDTEDHIYLDLGVVNNDNNGSQAKKNLVFSETRTSNILENPSDYQLSVVRFQMDTPNTSLPIFVPLLNTQGTPHKPNLPLNSPQGFFDPNMNPNITAYYVTIALLNTTNDLIRLSISTPVRWFPEDASAAPPNNGISNLYASGFPSGTPGRRDADVGGVGISPRMSRTLLGPVSQIPPNSFNFDALENDLPTTGVQDNNIIYTEGSTLTAINNFLLTFTLEYFQIGDVSDFIPGYPPGTDCFILNDMPDYISFPCASTISATQILTPSAGLIADPSTILTGPITISGTPDFTFKTGNYGEFDDWLYIIRSPKLLNYTRGMWYSPTGGPSPPDDPYYNLTFKFNQTFRYKITADLGTTVVDGLTYRTFQTDTLINYTLPSYGQAEQSNSIWRWLYNDNDLAGENMLLPQIELYRPFISSQDTTTGYYNCYTPQWWINCVNHTIADVWDAIRTGEPEIAPFIVLESGVPKLMTPIITLSGGGKVGFACSPSNVTGDGSQPVYLNGRSDTIRAIYALFFNEPLYNLFSSFNSVYYGNDFVSINKALIGPLFVNPLYEARLKYFPNIFSCYIQPINNNGLNVIYVSPELSYVVTGSEYSPIPMWSPIQSIRFSSNLLPNINSYTCLPISFNTFGVSTQTQQSVGGNNSQSSNAITDIQVALTTGYEYKPTVSYVPKGEYRLIDLLGECPIQAVDFIVSYVDKYGAEVPFRLGSQCGANLKLMFRRKRFDYADFDEEGD